MEPITRTTADLANLMPRDGGGDASEMEGFNRYVEEISSKVSELEQRVNEVEQFYATHKQLNLKDKVKEKHLMVIDKQQQGQKVAAADKRMKEVMRQFAGILRQITQHKWAHPFMEPVDVVGLGLHDYYEVIEKPMDFTTIKKKMEARDGTGYKNVREIYADVRLVFKNAMKYNDERDDVHVMAKTLLEKFEDKWLQLLPKVAEAEKGLVEEETTAQVAVKLAQEASHANMARDLSKELREVDMHLEELKESVVQKCRKMSIQEKKKLISALVQLGHEDLMRAMEIVAENNPTFQPTAQEVVLDIDAQSELTLWRLKVFVQDTQARKSKAVCDNSNEKHEKMNTKNTAMVNSNTVINHSKNNSRQKREISDALTKTSSKRPKKISLSSLPR